MWTRGVRLVIFAIGILAALIGCGNFSLSSILDGPPGGPTGPVVLTVAPDTVNATTGTTVQFTAQGGLPPYAWSEDTDSGLINGSGMYTVPSAVGTYTVTVTDSEGSSLDATVIASSLIPLTISPTSLTIDAGASAAFSGNGGSGNPLNYTWAVIAGLGGMAGSTYNAPWAATAATVQLTDTVTTEQRTAVVTVRAPTAPQINPSSANLAAGGSLTFSATGGSGSYSYARTGVGSMAGATYTAPWASGTATVTVTDTNTSLTASAPVSISAAPAVTIAPTAITINAGDSISFTAGGGSGSYTWSETGLGSLAGTTYISTGSAEAATVRVDDLNTGGFAEATVTVTVPVLLSISPKVTTVNAGDSITFSASAGVPPYIYSKISGGGSLAGQTYTAPWSATTVVIRVTDSDTTPATDDATVTVNPPPALSIAPATATLNVGQSVTFSGSGGSGNPLNYTYAKISGGGSLAGAVYTAPGSATTAVIRLTDALTSQTSDATVTVNPPPALTLSPAAANVLSGGAVSFTGRWIRQLRLHPRVRDRQPRRLLLHNGR